MRLAEDRTFDRILTTCATQIIEKGPLAERMVRTRSASDQKSPLEVLANLNGPRARDIGLPVTYKCSTRTKKVRTRRAEIRTFDRILSTYATLAIEKVPLATRVTRISSLGFLMNENGPRARGRGSLIIDIRSALKKASARRADVRPCDRILSVRATQ